VLRKTVYNKKALCFNPPAPNLGGEKVFFDISKIAHNASNFLYIKKGGAPPKTQKEMLLC